MWFLGKARGAVQANKELGRQHDYLELGSRSAREALVYCGTPPVSAINTLALLESPMHAIWFPPGARRTKPSPGDAVWLVWRERPGVPAMVLGAGKLRATPEGDLLWTNRSAPGIRELAKEFGYGGPTNMAFLRLERPRIAPGNLTVPGLEVVPTGLSEADEDQRRALSEVLPITS